jgi:hypothetical protein
MSVNFVLPIKRIDLEFINSNVTSFDDIIKIKFIRNPGIVGDLELLKLFKIVVDSENAGVFEDNVHLLHYMSNAVYMSNDIYMGGLDLYGQNLVKDSATLVIENASVKKYKFLLDYMLNPNDIHLYSLQYRFRGVLYQTDWVISYKPIKSDVIGNGNQRPSITSRNLRYRGPNEAQKYTEMNIELECDKTILNNIMIDSYDNIETLIEERDIVLNSLYNIMDRVDILKKLLVAEAAENIAITPINCKRTLLGI